ncbi:MAG: hypothetical protein MUC29_09365 [Pyrinomonadaceae bacterium]|nr:hypothetical protein [Pyrinomonadaceae bacterium]
MENFSLIHNLNIFIHVLAGIFALLLGFVIFFAKKGGKLHKKLGKSFLYLLFFVIFTGLIGVFVFERNTFLLVITVLSGYQGFSGYRILQTKSNRPQLFDISVAIISLICVAYFLYYFKSIGMIWSPIIIYSTVGTLLFLIIYDFARYLIPKSVYGKFWIYEHIYKMIGTFTALLAAFTGTVFANYQPYSQILPPAFGFLLQIYFIGSYLKNSNNFREMPKQNEKS